MGGEAGLATNRTLNGASQPKLNQGVAAWKIILKNLKLQTSNPELKLIFAAPNFKNPSGLFYHV